MHIRRRYVEAIAIDRDGTLHRRLLVTWQLPRISAIPSFFELKEAGGVSTLSEKNRIVDF
jgi:hypothetical protein